MGQFFDEIPDNLYQWIEKQHMFWTATSPLSGFGHVNVSPKCTRGMFHLVNKRKVWYEDMSGSGVETISHLREPGNGRITILFQAFEGPPRIVRLFGTGTVYEYGTPEYDEYIPPETRVPGSRAVIMIDVHKVGSSCGYAIPFYEYKQHRNTLLQWAEKKEAADNDALHKSDEISEQGMINYWKTKNTHSIDGIPGLATASEAKSSFKTRKFSFHSYNATIASSTSKSKVVGMIVSGFVDGKFLAGISLGVVVTAVIMQLVVGATVTGHGGPVALPKHRDVTDILTSVAHVES